MDNWALKMHYKKSPSLSEIGIIARKICKEPVSLAGETKSLTKLHPLLKRVDSRRIDSAPVYAGSSRVSHFAVVLPPVPCANYVEDKRGAFRFDRLYFRIFHPHNGGHAEVGTCAARITKASVKP